MDEVLGQGLRPPRYGRRQGPPTSSAETNSTPELLSDVRSSVEGPSGKSTPRRPHGRAGRPHPVPPFGNPPRSIFIDFQLRSRRKERIGSTKGEHGLTVSPKSLRPRRHSRPRHAAEGRREVRQITRASLRSPLMAVELEPCDSCGVPMPGAANRCGNCGKRRARRRGHDQVPRDGIHHHAPPRVAL
jgi:hypothetical protein